MHTHLNPKAVRKAMQAVTLLSKAAALMREAADLSDALITAVPGGAKTMSGRYDFLAWAAQIEQILSCDNGEAGIGPTMQRMTREGQ